MDYQILEQKLGELGIKQDQNQLERFHKFYQLLIEWNKVMNLTGITEYEDVVEKHFEDSLSIIKAIDLSGIHTVIDVGTGAGFPGIPLKIAFPHLRVVLLDSLNKRIKFLDEVISQLGLTEIRTIHGRAEEYARKEEYREQFDLCVSRAVANLSTLSEYCLPFVRVEGIFAAYKGNDCDKECAEAGRAVHLLGGELKAVKRLGLPDGSGRAIVLIKKRSQTSTKYPRPHAKIAKNPLV